MLYVSEKAGDCCTLERNVAFKQTANKNKIPPNDGDSDSLEISGAVGLGHLTNCCSKTALTELSIDVRFFRLRPWALIFSTGFWLQTELSASSSHFCSNGFNLHMFLKLSCKASNRHIVVWLNTLPYSVPRARPTSAWVKPSLIRRCLNCLANASKLLTSICPSSPQLISVGCTHEPNSPAANGRQGRRLVYVSTKPNRRVSNGTTAVYCLFISTIDDGLEPAIQIVLAFVMLLIFSLCSLRYGFVSDMYDVRSETIRRLTDYLTHARVREDAHVVNSLLVQNVFYSKFSQFGFARKLDGLFTVNISSPTFEELQRKFQEVSDGGQHVPRNCTSVDDVAIIIPYRDRERHLRTLLLNLHSFLIRQQLYYKIFIIEQVKRQTFNRGKLMNVGFLEAMRLYNWTCFVFHDVDLLPENDLNSYSCLDTPRHLSVAVDKFNYRLPYASIFGGVTALTAEQFRRINGFSNEYWGWGGEDDDFYIRVNLGKYMVHRHSEQIGRYKMIKHSSESLNEANPCRYRLLREASRRWRMDGLNSIRYAILNITEHQLFTRILVDLREVVLRNGTRLSFLLWPRTCGETYEIGRRQIRASYKPPPRGSKHENVKYLCTTNDPVIMPMNLCFRCRRKRAVS
ncbi:Beta-1,4-N-acetylgalactosaminyltransferase bre-4 [Trichinella patagoniensis]|uniref:Beta-1,4-N-acetylgalactosaminyltransferase bre-4 n=1 Tax=Trichinella patagoniensis TaxID=990121 RepID=A0A0V0Z8G4_9BILA|nr:Beta-1,4-N-acetylgalactosaminyltransferase bre-4 [Trichinella patagoniensis]KRY08888.1 Beta-1,4-N-acetylgalactosaminyltransferase bre-4 [Trichinella patagoniensis]